MRRMMCFFIVAIACATAALAEQMNAQAYDSYTRGKTLIYSLNGVPYGAEIHFENQRVRWSFLDGECKEGTWYEEAGLICFVYEDRPAPQCWGFEKGKNGLIARFEGNQDTTALYETRISDEPLMCLGPEVGV